MTGRYADWRLAVGGIFHGNSPNGASLICLVTSVTDTATHARRVTTQEYLQFNRLTGAVEMDADQIPGRINSTCPLPDDIHDIMLGLAQNSALKRMSRS